MALDFIVFPKDWINQSNEYEAIPGIQNITHKGLSEQSSFTFDSYKIFVKRFHFLCFLKVPWVIISNERNQNEECHVFYSMKTIKKTLYTSLHRIKPVLLAYQTLQKLLGLFYLSPRLPDSVLKKSIV